jgi:hypothetical protein
LRNQAQFKAVSRTSQAALKVIAAACAHPPAINFTEDDMTVQTIRRRDNGTIDIDFYRQQTLVERAAVMTTTGRHIGSAIRPALAVLILIATMWALPPSRPVPATVVAGTLTNAAH